MEKRSEIKKKLIIMMIVLLMIGCGQQTDVASGGVGRSLRGSNDGSEKNCRRSFLCAYRI